MRRVLVVLIVLFAARSASAGRTFYGWLPYGTEVMPERGVELQTWVYERDNLGDDHSRESSVWLGPLIGITDQLELVLPVELEWLDSDTMMQPTFTFKRFGAELRYRLVTADAEHAPPFVPLIRVAAKRDIQVRDATILEANAIASYQTGRVHAMIDAGVVATVTPNDTKVELRPGIGVSIQAVGDLRFGLEGYGEIPTKGDSSLRWWAVGPNMAYTHGRFWLSAAYGIGIVNIKAAPRILWGVAF